MAGGGTIIVLTDRVDRSRSLAERIGAHCASCTIGVDEQPDVSGAVAAVITDVRFRRLTTIEALRRFLAGPRLAGAPVLALLRDDSYLERVQAAALGATFVFLPGATISDIFAALTSTLGPIFCPPLPSSAADVTQQVEQARVRFGAIFGTAARGDAIAATDVNDASRSILATVAESGIRQWLEVVWRYDNATYQHCLLVTGLAAEFARSLKLSANDQEHLTRGAVLHDIGKARIPLSILNKPEALTAEEAEAMRAHPILGYEMLRGQAGFGADLLDVVLRHHEMLDGSGYPDGVTAAQIPDLVRLVTICDIYTALIERRPYRPPTDPVQAFKILQDMEGKLEPALIRAFAPVAERSAASLLERPRRSAA